MRAGPLLALSLLVALLPSPASAGTQADPEIKDPAGDGAGSGKDIVGVWLDLSDPENLVVTFEAGANVAAEYPSFHAIQVRWTLWFKPTTALPSGKNAAYLSVRVANGQTSPTAPSHSAYYGTTSAAGTFDNLNNEVILAAPKIEGKLITLTLPMTNLKGFAVGTDALKDLYANVVLAHKGPVSTAGGPDVNVIRETYDRAPNSGFGRDFTGASAAAELVDFTLEGPENQTLPAGSNKTVGLTIANNGTATNVTLSANSSSASVMVTFANQTVALDQNGTADVELTIEAGDDAPAEATIEVTAASGNVTRTVSFVVTVPAPTSSNATTNATASETAGAQEAEGDGAPALPLVLALAAIGLAMAVRHGRRKD